MATITITIIDNDKGGLDISTGCDDDTALARRDPEGNLMPVSPGAEAAILMLHYLTTVMREEEV